MIRNIVLYGASPDPGPWPESPLQPWVPSMPATIAGTTIDLSPDPVTTAVNAVRAAHAASTNAKVEHQKWRSEEALAENELVGIRRALALAKKQEADAVRDAVGP